MQLVLIRFRDKNIIYGKTKEIEDSKFCILVKSLFIHMAKWHFGITADVST